MTRIPGIIPVAVEARKAVCFDRSNFRFCDGFSFALETV